MRKQLFPLSLLVLCLGLIIIGCGSTTTAQTSMPPVIDAITPAPVQGSVTVYYVNGSELCDKGISEFQSKYPDVTINKKTFDSASELDQIVLNDINKSGGPDVIIFNSATTLDAADMARSGSFTALDNFIYNDESFQASNYLRSAIESGKIEDTQFILPIAFTQSVVFYDGAAVDEEISNNALISPELFLSAVTGESDTLSKNTERAALALGSNLPIIRQLMYLSGNSAVSHERESFNANERQLRETAEIAKLLQAEKDKSIEVASAYVKALPDLASHITYYIWLGKNLPNDIRGYESIYKAGGVGDFEFSAFTTSGGDHSAASITLYGAVTRGSDNTTAAYELLRSIMDSKILVSRNQVFEMPVHIPNLHEYLDTLEKASTVNSNITLANGQTVRIEPLSAKAKQRIIDILDGIGICFIPNPVIESALEEAFEPYFANQATFDDCLSVLMQKFNDME